MKKASPHKGWHSRGYLPHLDAPGEIQALTFRLADAMPAKVITRWKREVAQEVDFSKRERALRHMIARYEDAGHGDCLLQKPACAEIVQTALRHFDGVRYHLLEWCIMPNHVHAMIRCEPGFPPGSIVKSWKIFTAQGINQYLGRTGAVWSKDYFDRYIRDNDHLADARAYIRNNPVNAGLCGTSEEWCWSSAFSSHDPGSRIPPRMASQSGLAEPRCFVDPFACESPDSRSVFRFGFPVMPGTGSIGRDDRQTEACPGRPVA